MPGTKYHISNYCNKATIIKIGQIVLCDNLASWHELQDMSYIEKTLTMRRPSQRISLRFQKHQSNRKYRIIEVNPCY